MSDEALRQLVLDVVSDSVKRLAYYDRKEDEDLSVEMLEDLVERGVVTAMNETYVFVRFWGDLHSKACNAKDLQ